MNKFEAINAANEVAKKHGIQNYIDYVVSLQGPKFIFTVEGTPKLTPAIIAEIEATGVGLMY